jgi:hypothetical protein
MIFDLGGGKQVVLRNGRLQIWANRGSLGVELTPEQMREIGLAMFQLGRRVTVQSQGCPTKGKT